eukprot:gene17451-20822_t
MTTIDKLEKSIIAAQEEIRALEVKQATTDLEINSLVDLTISRRSNNDSKDRLNLLFQESVQDLRSKSAKIQAVIALKQELVNALIAPEQQGRAQDIWNQLRVSSFRPSNTSPSSSQSTNGGGDQMLSQASALSLADEEDDKEITKWEFDAQDIVINRDQKMGAGAFGAVYRGAVRGKEVAVKKLTQQFFDETVLGEFRREVSLMCKLRNPHLLLFMGACTKPGNLCIITELMPKGSVHALLRAKEDSPDFIDFRRAILVARDTALGMNWLHLSTPPILHLDLKPANLLVDANWVVKVADFGLSKIKRPDGKTSGQAGSPLYMAPEMLMNRDYDEKADVYSFAMLLWELLTKLEPYNGEFRSFSELSDAVVGKRYRPSLADHWGPKLRDLLTRCWDAAPSRRPSFEEITRSRLLDHVLIEGMLTDINARHFWTTNFLGRDEVPWVAFYTAFCSTFGLDPRVYTADSLKIKCLKLLLAEIDTDVVRMSEFGRFLSWFGPLSASGADVLDRVHAVCALKGFLGETSSKNVIQFLANKKTGTYLVRFSSTDPGCYALSYVAKTKEIAHAKIIHRPGQGYIHLGGTTHYPSLEELIKNTGKLLGLKDPYEGGQFYALIYASKNPAANNPPAYFAVAPGKKKETTVEKQPTRAKFTRDDIELKEILGKGSYGIVHSGTVHGANVAVKEIIMRPDTKKTVIAEFVKEVEMLSLLRHPHLLLFMGACDQDGLMYIVTELMAKGSVESLVERHQIDFKLAISIARQSALGINSMHRTSPHPILHLDIKPGNLLVDDKWTVKVADFGLSKFNCNSVSTGMAGSPLYMAPEMLLDKEYNEKSDVYSWAITLWECLALRDPHRDCYDVEQLTHAVCVEKRRPPFLPSWGPLLCDLLTQCWHDDMNQRPSFQTIIDRRYLDHILLEHTIKNEHARQFWAEYYISETTVEWCMRALIVKEGNMVDLESFAKFSTYFPEFDNGSQLVGHVMSVCTVKGFVGDILSSEAIQRLSHREDGTYIIRFSSEVGAYAISVTGKNKDEVLHAKVTYNSQDRKYSHHGGSKTYETLPDLLKSYNTSQKQLQLKKPLEGGKYYDILNSRNAQRYTQYL